MKYELDARKVEIELQKAVQEMLDLANKAVRSNQAAIELVLHCNDTLRPINKLLEATRSGDIKAIRDAIVEIKIAATRVSNLSNSQDAAQIQIELDKIQSTGQKLLAFRIMPWEGEIDDKTRSKI
jgi:hypothetical protein